MHTDITSNKIILVFDKKYNLINKKCYSIIRLLVSIYFRYDRNEFFLELFIFRCIYLIHLKNYIYTNNAASSFFTDKTLLSVRSLIILLICLNVSPGKKSYLFISSKAVIASSFVSLYIIRCTIINLRLTGSYLYIKNIIVFLYLRIVNLHLK